MKKNEFGFGLVEEALLFVIVGMLVSMSWYIWSNRSKGNSPSSNTPTSTVPAAKKTPVTKPTATKQTDTVPEPETPKTNAQYINGASFNVPISLGNILSWSLTAERSNLTSSTLLDKEKELYGDATLYCKANFYALGRITVKDESSPFPGDSLIKKLDSGKYLFYSDDSKFSFCYTNRAGLQGMIDDQVSAIKTALSNAK